MGNSSKKVKNQVSRKTFEEVSHPHFLYPVAPTDSKALNIFAWMFLQYVEEKFPDKLEWKTSEWRRLTYIINEAEAGDYKLWLVTTVMGDPYSSIAMTGVTPKLEMSSGWVSPLHRGEGVQPALLEGQKEAGGSYGVVHRSNLTRQRNLIEAGFTVVTPMEEDGQYQMHSLPKLNATSF